jgi:hypothetical protein
MRSVHPATFLLAIGAFMPPMATACPSHVAAAPTSLEKKPMAKLSMPAPKRVAPPEIPAITIGGLRYEALLWGRERGLGQNGGLIDIVEASTGKSVGVIKVYAIEYQSQLETDVQDVFFESMTASVDGKQLMVTDEKGRRFQVDLEQRTAKPAP